MIRVVIDTNVCVSAMVFGGKPATVLQLSCALEGRAEVIVSGDRAVLMRTGWEGRWGVARSGDAARTSACATECLSERRWWRCSIARR